MASDNFLKVSSTTYRGAQALQIHDLLLSLSNLATELTNAMAQSVADDGTYAALNIVLGTTSTADAQAVHDLVGSLNTELVGSGTVGQILSRVNRNF